MSYNKKSAPAKQTPQSLIIKTYARPAEVFADIERLNNEFRKEFKKSANVQICYSCFGPIDKDSHGLSVWHEDNEDDEKELTWIKSKI